MAITSICEATNCTGCGVCSQVCPSHAIVMKENEEGFRYPVVDAQKCIECGQCIRRCPINSAPSKQEPSEFYMGWHRSEDILRNSSSGGAFTAIAEYVLERNGVVFGAAMEPVTRELQHQPAYNRDELAALRMSKYYQSRAENAYPQVKQLLKEGKQVLFAGTACQVGALYSYLGNSDLTNLITVDVLCHGVASKKVIDAYIASQQKRFRKEIKSFSFRVKEGEKGWQRGCGRMHVSFADGTDYVAEGAYDTFFLGFNHNFFLRESCYSCQYCGVQRVADFTLADFWGCKREDIPPEQMWLGVSLVLFNSPKSKAIRKELEKNMVLVPINAEEAIPFNLALSRPQDRPEVRDRFFSSMERIGYFKTIERAFPKRFMKFRLKNFLKKVLPHAIAKKIMRNI